MQCIHVSSLTLFLKKEAHTSDNAAVSHSIDVNVRNVHNFSTKVGYFKVNYMIRYPLNLLENNTLIFDLKIRHLSLRSICIFLTTKKTVLTLLGSYTQASSRHVCALMSLRNSR